MCLFWVDIGKVTSPGAPAAPTVPSTEKVEPPAKKIRAVAAPTIGVPYGALDDFQYHNPKMVAVMPKVPLVDDNKTNDLDSLTLLSFSFLSISL